MRLLSILSLFIILSLISAYKMETINTFCYWLNSACHKTHAEKLLSAINKHTDYISHSTTSTKTTFHTIIVYK